MPISTRHLPLPTAHSNHGDTGSKGLARFHAVAAAAAPVHRHAADHRCTSIGPGPHDRASRHWVNHFAQRWKCLKSPAKNLPTCKVGLGNLAAFRAAGMEFNAALVDLRVSLERRANGSTFLRLTGTGQSMNPSWTWCSRPSGNLGVSPATTPCCSTHPNCVQRRLQPPWRQQWTPHRWPHQRLLRQPTPQLPQRLSSQRNPSRLPPRHRYPLPNQRQQHPPLQRPHPPHATIDCALNAATLLDASPWRTCLPTYRWIRCWWPCCERIPRAFIQGNVNRVKAGAVLDPAR